MKTMVGPNNAEQLCPENETEVGLLASMIKRGFVTGSDEFSYDWKTTPDEDGVWHGVLLDERVLEEGKTTPSFPVTVAVRPDGSVVLCSGRAEGLRIWENGLVTIE